MNIKITSFTSPFSFFCKVEDGADDVCFERNVGVENMYIPRNELSHFNHGQYVAVFWKNKWNRGVITMESQFLIWLIDFGFYLRPDDKTVFINLPAEHKNYPTKIFEASIHGVSPIDKMISDYLVIENKRTTCWNRGAVERAQTLIENATRIFFVPLAMMCTKHNDIVLGDLYLQVRNKGIVNLTDELALWPIFLEKDKEVYIENLTIHYNTRRKHRACLLKPDLNVEIPTMALETSLAEYTALCENAPKVEWSPENAATSEDGSSCTIPETGIKKNKKQKYCKLSVEEIEMYAHMYVTIYNRKYNVLKVLLNKMTDLNMCEKYKDYDLKYIGRANHRLRQSDEDLIVDRF